MQTYQAAPRLPVCALASVFNVGPVALYLEDASGAFIAALDRATGTRAEALYRPAYLAHAKTQARAAWECRAER